MNRKTIPGRLHDLDSETEEGTIGRVCKCGGGVHEGISSFIFGAEATRNDLVNHKFLGSQTANPCPCFLKSKLF